MIAVADDPAAVVGLAVAAASAARVRYVAPAGPAGPDRKAVVVRAGLALAVPGPVVPVVIVVRVVAQVSAGRAAMTVAVPVAKIAPRPSRCPR